MGAAGRLVATVERKSLQDWSPRSPAASSATRLGELAGLPRAALVVEDRYSQVFKLEYVRPAVVADRLAELQARCPGVPIVFCETRALVEVWTYRYLAAAVVWTGAEPAAVDRTGSGRTETAPVPPEPTTAEVRVWARAAGLDVPDRGRLRPDVWDAGAGSTASGDAMSRGPG